MAAKEKSARVGGAGHRFKWKPEDDPYPSSRPIAGARKKATFGVRPWVTIDSTGQGQTLQVGRHAIMRRTGLPARDLRILDPLLSYPSTVLGRERAIVVNLEHIKAIITAHEVLLLNAMDPSVDPFVRELQRRILLRHHQNGGNGRNGERTSGNDLDNPQSRTPSPLHGSADDQDVNDKNDSNPAKFLPFEFIALEMCLEAACGCLENEAASLEKEAYPALDKLTSKISTLNLEHVRQIKSRLVAITGRVQKARDELEHLLDDDDDMAEMYLTEKLMQQRMSDSSPHSSSPNEQGYAMDRDRVPNDIIFDEQDVQNSCEEEEVHSLENDERLLSGTSMFHEEGHLTRTCSTRSSSKHLDVEELEMLLEAYFVQIDSILNKLSTLREYVDDTEDYINIMLDDKQNHLLQMGVVLSTATLIVSAYVVLAGLFGMNIKTDLFDENKSGNAEFLWTVGGGAIGSLFLYVAAIAWCKHQRLLE